MIFKRAHKLTILGVTLVTLLLPSSARAVADRDALMATAGAINLFFLGMTTYSATRTDPRLNADIQAIPNDNIPFDSPDFILFNKLVDLNLNLRTPQGIRILPRRAMSYYSLQVDQDADADGPNSLSRQIADYLQQRQGYLSQQWLSPEFVISAHSTYLYTNSLPRPVPGVNGIMNPFFAMRGGQFSQDGQNGSLGFNIHGRLASWLSYAVSPRAILSSNDGAFQDHAEFYLVQGYLKFNIRNLELQVGKDAVIWGKGRYASLAFSGDAEPFYLVRVSNTLPVLLPGPLRFLGPTKIDFFFALNDSDTVFPYSLIHGMKTTFQPHRRFEFGIAQIVQFGGEGSGTWSPTNILYEGSGGRKNLNRNFTLDFSWLIPVIEVEPYVELFWEDCCPDNPFNPRDVLNLFGLYVPNLAAGGRADLAVEWARTNNITYRHSRYQDGFYYHGHAIGHPLGPQGNGIYGIFRYFHSPKLWGKFIAAFERRKNRSNPTPEDRYRVEFDVRHELTRAIRLRYEAGYERVKSFNFNSGSDRNNFLAGFHLEIS